MLLNQCVVILMFLGLCCCVWAQIDSSDEFDDDMSDDDIPSGKLIQISIVTRHGQRTPKSPYPADPYKDPEYWPEGWLQLTAVGAEQHRDLGRWLRRSYNDTIPQIFTSKSVRIRSTGISRTLASAFALTSALFPDQAIPIHSSPSKYDKLFSPHKSCPAFKEEMDRYLSSPQVVEEERRRQPFYKWAGEQTGRAFSGVDAAEGLYSLLTIEKQRGYVLPKWTDAAYPQPLRNLTASYLARSSATSKLARLRYGTLLKDILVHAEKAGLRSPKKFLMYSAHDFTVVGLLNCLGVFDGQPSGFASSITFEVRHGKTPQGNMIDMFYRNETHAPPVRLIVKGCGHPCYIKNLQKALSKIIPKDIEAECRTDDGEMSRLCSGVYVSSFTDAWIFFCVCLTLAFLAVICYFGIFAEPNFLIPVKRKREYTMI